MKDKTIVNTVITKRRRIELTENDLVQLLSDQLNIDTTDKIKMYIQHPDNDVQINIESPLVIEILTEEVKTDIE